jgi:predicted membrane channel-forming protein YqfA (hemolysin III family)
MDPLTLSVIIFLAIAGSFIHLSARHGGQDDAKYTTLYFIALAVIIIFYFGCSPDRHIDPNDY